MRGYGQFCPVALSLEIVGERWTLLVIRELFSGSERFNEIQRGVPLMSPSLLSQRLKALERAGIVARESDGEQPPRPRYRLTEAGRELWPVVACLGTWGQRWARLDVRPEQLDPSLLMWDVRRGMDVSLMPDRRLVLRFHFTGLARGRPTWWLIADSGDVDLCLSDPGYDVDLSVEADLKAMIQVWMGDIAYRDAQRRGAVRLTGPPALVREFPSWLKLNLLAGVPRPGAASPAGAGVTLPPAPPASSSP